MRKSQLAGTRSLSPPLLENCSNKALIVFNIMVQLRAGLGLITCWSQTTVGTSAKQWRERAELAVVVVDGGVW